tara:strand:- start:651 stop:1511 length:861 start_codon:yes stop_codon:yes gene_type:complete
MITSKTNFLALIGNPVNHSLSPIMQNAAIKYLGLDLIYFSIPCNEKDFEIVIKSLSKINCKGINITIPFKEKALNYCSKISPLAEQIKAVNTLKPDGNGEWHGINTDVEGLIYPLKNLNLTDKKGIILGSGGAARSAIQGLTNLKMSEITVISRNQISLDSLLNDFKNQPSLKGISLKNPNIPDFINSADLIVNTTPVGMINHKTTSVELPFGDDFWTSLNSETVVYDLIYNPQETHLLNFSRNKGCQTINGTKMLIAQGAKSLSYWTDGLKIPVEIMEQAIRKYL